VADTGHESIADTGWVAPAGSQASVKAANILWGGERSLIGSWDAVTWVSVSSSSDDILSRLLNTSWVAFGWNRSLTGSRVTAYCLRLGSSSAGILCRLLNTRWVARGRHDRWDIGAGQIISDEIGNRRDGGGGDGEELAGINVINEAEEEALAAGLGSTLGHAEGCSFCKESY
jgi:hypothetical protein